MKKVVLLISMVLCVSLFVSCANMFTTKVETNDLNIPTGTYHCIAINDIENGSVDQERPSMSSMGAIINKDSVKFDNCTHIGSFNYEFLAHGKIKIKNSDREVDTLKWRYENERLFITNTTQKKEYVFKHV